MTDICTLIAMLCDEHNPERLAKILGYIDESIQSANETIAKLNQLRLIANKRIEDNLMKELRQDKSIPL